MIYTYLPYLYSLPSTFLLVVVTRDYKLSKQVVQKLLNALHIEKKMLEVRNVDYVIQEVNGVDLGAYL